MRRPVFSFRPNPDSPEHRKAWEILKAVPEGQKNAFLVRAILKAEDQKWLERVIKQTIREELKGLRAGQEMKPEKEEMPGQMLDFLASLSGDF